MNYKIKLNSSCGDVEYINGEISLTAERDNDDARFSMAVEFPEWEQDTYVFLPACAYDGNRFKKIECQYPPMYRKADCGKDAEPIISDVPALNLDQSGKIEVTSGDMSVPCFGAFFKAAGKAFFIFTEQACKGKNIGFLVERGKLTVQFPAIRSKCYRICRNNEPSEDFGVSVAKGENVTSTVLIKEFDCESITEFFALFFWCGSLCQSVADFFGIGRW